MGLTNTSTGLYAKAVSYTHLDVYKRQMLPLMATLEKLIFFMTQGYGDKRCKRFY